MGLQMLQNLTVCDGLFLKDKSDLSRLNTNTSSALSLCPPPPPSFLWLTIFVVSGRDQCPGYSCISFSAPWRGPRDSARTAYPTPSWPSSPTSKARLLNKMCMQRQLGGGGRPAGLTLRNLLFASWYVLIKLGGTVVNLQIQQLLFSSPFIQVPVPY